MRPHADRPLVYVAGPYGKPEPVENTHNAIRAAERLQSTGLVTAVVPHLSLLWHLVCPHPTDHWYDYDLALLARCDALLRLPGISVGADKEVVFARKRHIPVFHEAEEVEAWAQNAPR
jgi:hypothetical protein